MNIEEIKALIQLFEDSSLSELSLKREGTQLVLKREANATQAIVAPTEDQTAFAPVAQVPASDIPKPTPQIEPSRPTGHEITSPLVGTFYRRPSPEEPPYVEIGQQVKVGDTLCIVEAMKVMNEIKADCNGVILEISVEDGHIVEYGQPLLSIDPA